MSVPFINLKAQYEEYRSDIDVAIAGVIDKTTFIGGDAVRDFEKSIASFCSVKHAISCANGTDALVIALKALGIGEGDEVITSPFTFFASAEAISLVGASVVFADIEEDTYNINAEEIKKKITPKTKAIMPVSIFGQPSDMDAINEIASSNDLVVIEDGAQSFGASYKGRVSPALSHIGTTSFYPAKPLGCYGDGGAIFTNNSELAEIARLLANHGQSKTYEHEIVGHNSRLDAIQAVILSVKLKYFENEITKRSLIAKRYESLLGGVRGVITPTIKEGRTSVYAQYSILVKNRDTVASKMKEKGVPVAIHYAKPVYRQKAYDYLNLKPESFPVTEKTCMGIMSLPMSAFLTEEEQDTVCLTLASCLSEV